MQKRKHTYLTLFRVSETGLELVGDFVTEIEAHEYAEAEGIDSFAVIQTVVIETVEIKASSSIARTITARGTGGSAAAAADEEEEKLPPRQKGPVQNARSTKK
jgi:hypothetical protein